MEIRVLCVGDVVGAPGIERVRRSLRKLKNSLGADFVIVNGENASVVGITPDQAEDILDAGADVVTLGNHSFGKREIVRFLEDSDRILRPANYAPQAPGRGWAVYDTRFGEVAVIDLIGRCAMDYTPDNPFLLAEKLERVPVAVKIPVVFLLVLFSWILFKFTDFSMLGIALKGLFGLNGNGLTGVDVGLAFKNNLFFLIFSAVAATPLGMTLRTMLKNLSRRNQVWFWVNGVWEALHPVLLLILSAMALAGDSYNPFLYFQF